MTTSPELLAERACEAALIAQRNLSATLAAMVLRACRDAREPVLRRRILEELEELAPEAFERMSETERQALGGRR